METTWTSLLVEVLRFGGDASILRKGDPYLVVRADERAAEYRMELDHEEFLDLLDRLGARYAGRTSDEERKQAREKLGGVVTRMLQLGVPAQDQQIDVVLTAKELAALPLEAANGPDGEPLVLRSGPTVEITRRVRGSFRASALPWPARPRILFAAASPARDVPADEHARALRSALAPWIGALDGLPGTAGDENEVLTLLPRASLEEIRQACRARSGFSHVHLLAHGCAIDSGLRQRYGLQLHSEGGKGIAQVLPDALVEALAAGGALPNVVTLTACDSANVGSTVVSSVSLAHALHAAGVPVVLGSQFPLTSAGSTVIVEKFYGALLRPPLVAAASARGTDVRDALHEARLAVYERQAETGHDWMSLVAYVQLPEGYDERLLDVGLETELAGLRTAQRWADGLTRNADAPSQLYDRVAERLRDRIASLQRWAKLAADTHRRNVVEENEGLLGSAHKRLAEILHHRGRFEDDRERWARESREALEQARRWYELGFKQNLSAHWHGVQELSLEAVLRGRISRPWQWHTAIEAAKTACGSSTECWAAGSRAELHLLATYAGERRQLGEAVEALLDLERRVGHGDRFPLESTARQLERYVRWWTVGNGFFPGAQDLASEAKEVIERAGCARWSP